MVNYSVYVGGMNMNLVEIGKYLKRKRIDMHMTQKDLAKRLNISFQTISKWETGNSLPITAVLLPLSDLLEVSIEQILSAGEFREKKNKKVNVKEVKEAMESIIRLKIILGPNNGIYKSMINGINKDYDIDFEKAILDPQIREVLIAQSCIQLIIDGYDVAIEDIEEHITSESVREKLRGFLKKYLE